MEAQRARIISANENVITHPHRISADSARVIMANNSSVIVLDVRTESEFNKGHIERAVNFPLSELEANIEVVVPNMYALILIYCQRGNRSRQAVNILRQLGYSNAYDFGGIEGFNR